MRDTTVTIHPTIKQSVNAVLFYASQDEDKAIGKVIEEMLQDSPKYQELVRKYSL